jgi:hypothetical protein
MDEEAAPSLAGGNALDVVSQEVVNIEAGSRDGRFLI